MDKPLEELEDAAAAFSASARAETAARRQEVERILSYKVAAGKPLFPEKEKKEKKEV